MRHCHLKSRGRKKEKIKLKAVKFKNRESPNKVIIRGDRREEEMSKGVRGVGARVGVVIYMIRNECNEGNQKRERDGS